LNSNNSWVGTSYCSSTAYSQWTYVSNTYSGGGNITRMRAGLFSYGAFTVDIGYRYADNATFVSSCTYGGFRTSFGAINQYESSGARHSLTGHVDDSPNHTNCFVVYDI
jgi:hypothetical protein